MTQAQMQALLKAVADWTVENDAHEYLFTRDQWQLRGTELTCPRLVLDRSFRFVSYCEDDLPLEITQRRPVANWYADGEGYMALGVHIIALVLSDIAGMSR